LNFITNGWIHNRVDSADWLFHYLGTITTFIGVLMLTEAYIRVNDRYQPYLERFMIVGRKTFFIYIVHVIVLYSNFLGFGIKSIWYKELGPWQTVIGTTIFIAFLVFLANQHEWLKILWGRLKIRLSGFIISSQGRTKRTIT